MGEHCPPLPGRNPKVCLLHEGSPDNEPPIPSRGMQGGKRPPVCSRDHQMRQLWRAPRGAGRRLRLQEGGPPVCQEVAITPSPTRERGGAQPSPPPETPLARLRPHRRERCRARRRSRWRRGRGRPRPPKRWRQGSREVEGVLSGPFLPFSLFGGVVKSVFPLFLRQASSGGRRLGIPHYDCASWSEGGKG